MAGKKLDTIEEPSFGYNLIRFVAGSAFKFFYRKIEVFGKENIPDDHPVIFAPNHQNAVMDPLAVLSTQKSFIVFLARSDVFKSKFLINLLTFFKILPIYRQRDGLENLAKNDGIFDITVRILKKKRKICLMPEGNHGNQNKLRPLVKGMFRIAFTAQDELIDTSKPVQIVPTGLYYEDYVKSDKLLSVNYGKPINLADYHDLYREKPAIAINKLKQDLSKALSTCMVDIKSDDNYKSINFVTNIFSKYYSKKDNRPYFKIIKDLTDKFNRLCESKSLFLPQFEYFVNEYTALLEKYNLRDWVVKKKKFPLPVLCFNFLLLIILFPIFIPGYIINWLPYFIPVMSTKKIKDKQFHSSVRYVVFLLFVIFYYPVISVISGIVFKSVFIGLATFTGSFLLGLISLDISYLYKKTMAKLRFIKLKKRNKQDLNNLILLRKKIKLITDFVYNDKTL